MNDTVQPNAFKNHVFVEKIPQKGTWNMAVDEAMLEAAADKGYCSLRVYRWSEPTVSLGYFQQWVPDSVPAELTGLPVVRRLSGGGAILHHHELTYSLAIPRGHHLTQPPGQLYGLAHGRIVDVLTDMGIPIGCRGESVTAGNQEFLCFQRGDCNDLLVAGHKIVGSAQRRRRGAILQHGSLLLQRSPHAPEIPGLRELGYGIAADELLVTELTNALSGLLGGEEKHRESLPDGIIELATELEKNRYQKRDWKTHG